MRKPNFNWLGPLGVVRLAISFTIVSCSTLSGATTKGLNQIVTPDLQPLGQFSISFQAQHGIIGNPYQEQFELGISRSVEVAVFNGHRPGEQFLATEIGIIQRPDFLLSTGFLGASTRGDQPQPFIEAGYNKGAWRSIVGMQRIANANLPIYGLAVQTTKELLLQLDYLGGTQNFLTAGFTYSVTPAFAINPAIYMANSSGHKLYPYLVASWTFTAFK